MSLTLKQFIAALPPEEQAAIEQKVKEVEEKASRFCTVFVVVQHREGLRAEIYPVRKQPSYHEGGYTTYPRNTKAEFMNPQEAGEAVKAVLKNTMNVLRVEVWTNGRT